MGPAERTTSTYVRQSLGPSFNEDARPQRSITSYVEDVPRLSARADFKATEVKKPKVLVRGVKESIFGNLVRKPPATVEAFVREASNMIRALFARASHHQRAPGVAGPTPSIYDIGASISGIREIIREIVLEELRKLLRIV